MTPLLRSNLRVCHSAVAHPVLRRRIKIENNLVNTLIPKRPRTCMSVRWSFFFNFILFTLMWPCIVTNFFIIKSTRCTSFPNLLRHFRAVPLPIIRSLFTVHSALVHVIQVCRRLSSRTRMSLLESCLQTYMTCTSAEFTVNKLLMMGRGTARNM